MLNSCNCAGTLLDPATISKCSNCGCVHYQRPKVCQQPKNVRQSWVDECTVPKRKDVVPSRKNCGNDGNGRNGARKSDNQVCGILKRVSRQQSPPGDQKRRSSKKRTSSSRSPPPKKPGSAPPYTSVPPPPVIKPDPTAPVPQAYTAALSPASTATIPQAPTADLSPTSIAAIPQAYTADIPQAYTAALSPASTATIPQAPTADLSPTSADIPQASTAAIPQESTAAVPQASTAALPQATTAALPSASIAVNPPGSTAAIPSVSTAPITPPASGSSPEPPGPPDLTDSVKPGKRASFLLPGASEAIHANGDKVQNGKTAQNFASQPPVPGSTSVQNGKTEQNLASQPPVPGSTSVQNDKTEQNLASQPPVPGSTSVSATLRPSASQSEHTISKSLCHNDKITDKFSCFLKKVKSTEMFIRNLFNEVNTNIKPPCTDKRPSCGICINNKQSNTFCGMVGDSCATPQNNQQSDCDAGISSNQTLDLIELKNTIQCLKDMMCKQPQNGCPNNDATLQRVLGELKKHVKPDEIEKLLKTPPSTDNTVAVMEESMAPFVFVKCRPFCDQHGVFIVEWKVTSFLGIGGYEIYVDGNMKQNIPSAIRNTALIPGINSKCEHLVTVCAIPLPDCNLNSNDKWTPASCSYKPGCSR